MARAKVIITLAACGLCLAALAATLAGTSIQAAPEDVMAGFSIPWWTVDNGGGTSQGGPYVLSGTIGQPDAESSSGGNYRLKSGFWSGVFEYVTFIPFIKR